jgi:hypothetical protein
LQGRGTAPQGQCRGAPTSGWNEWDSGSFDKADRAGRIRADGTVMPGRIGLTRGFDLGFSESEVGFGMRFVEQPIV